MRRKNMKRIIEISASFTGTIPTGQYENEKPFYAVKEILELDSDNKDDWDNLIKLHDDGKIASRQKQLHDICYDQFKTQAERSNSERIAKQYKNIRFYDGLSGKKYPSVTSIIGIDKDFCMPPDELNQYAARGTIIHKQVESFLRNGTFLAPWNIPEVSADWLTVKNGSLGLECTDVNFQAFFKDYPIKVVSQEQETLNHEYRYGGRYDILCTIDSSNKGKWEKIEGIQFDVPTILDIKTSTSLDKMSGLMQQAAYAKTLPDVKQIGLIHLTKENKCGFAKPVIETNIDRYWNLFLNKLNLFRTRYGV
jgi:hypothetical protein